MMLENKPTPAQAAPEHEPWLSVIVPVYNTSRYLRKCLDSILGQSLRDFEMILVNDGSTDDSGEICAQYAAKDQRIRLFTKENGGLFQTRIYGLARARGTFFTFCDSDDYYCRSDAFALLRRKLEEQPCDAVQFGFINRYRHVQMRGMAPEPFLCKDEARFTKEEYPAILCGDWDGSHLTTTVWDKLYHRRLAAGLPDPDHAGRLFQGEDVVFNLHFLENCRSMLFLPDRLYAYRQTSGGTRRYSRSTIPDLDRVSRYQLRFLARWPGEEKARIQRKIYVNLAGWIFPKIQSALQSLPETEVRSILQADLSLPSVLEARQFFAEHPEESWEAAELLRRGDPDAYIRCARQHNREHRVRKWLRNAVRNRI